MVHLEERDGQLKIKRDKLAPAKRPAVCIAFIGALLVVAGAMQIGVSAQGSQVSNTALEIIGPICLIIGLLLLVAGFMYKYIVHHKAKEKAQERGTAVRSKKYLVTVRRNSRPTTANSRPGTARPTSARPNSRGSNRPPSSAASVNTIASGSTAMTYVQMESPPMTSRTVKHDIAISCDLPGYDVMSSSDEDTRDFPSSRDAMKSRSARSPDIFINSHDASDIFTIPSLAKSPDSLNNSANSTSKMKSSEQSKFPNKSKAKSKSSKQSKSRVQSEVSEKSKMDRSESTEHSPEKVASPTAATLKTDGTPDTLSTGVILTVNSIPLPGQDQETDTDA